MERALPRTSPPIERSLQVVVLLLLVLLAYVLRPVLAAIVLGGFVVLVCYPPFEWLLARLRGRRRLATWIATFGVIVTIVAPIGWLAYLTAREAASGIRFLADQVAAIGGLSQLQQHLPRAVRPLLPNLTERGSAQLAQLATHVAELTPKVLTSLGKMLAELFLAIVTVFYLFQQGPEFVQFIRRVSPLRPSYTEALLLEFREVAQGLFWGNLVTAVFHGVAAGLGYWIAGVPKVIFLSALTMVASFIPAFGTATIWVPISIGLIVTGRVWQGIFLFTYGVAVVGGIDNFLRPLVSRGRMKQPELLMFLTIFGGISIFGPKGLLLGPLLGSLATTGLRLIERERTRTRGSAQ